MSSTNIEKNPYRSISFVLTLEQNMVTTITSCQLLVFIVSPSFLLIAADALHIFSLHFETLLITHRFGFCLTFLRSKRQDARQNVFSFTFPFVSYNTGLIFAKFFSKNS